MTTEKFIGNTGDVDWFQYGGTLIMKDTDGSLRGVRVDPWMLNAGEVEDEYDSEMKWEVSIFCIDKLELTEDNKLVCVVSKTKEWFSDEKSLGDIASCIGGSIADLKADFTSDDPIRLAHAYDDVGSYHGYNNLGSYPEYYTREEMKDSWFVKLTGEEIDLREDTKE
jgi:hypothetical protein